MAFTGFNLPDIGSLDFTSKQSTRKLQEYFFQLTEQLKFVLNNIDEDNLSDGLTQSLENAYKISTKAAAEASEAFASNTEAKAFAQKFTPVLDFSGSTFTIKAAGINTDSGERTNVQDATNFYTNFDSLRPVKFESKGTEHLGLIPDEVKAVCPLAADNVSIDYNKVVVMLIYEIIQLRSRLSALEGQ